MVATIGPVNELSLQGKDKPSRRSKTTSDDLLARRRGAATPDRQSEAIVVCPACNRKLRWRDRWPGRAVCPACGLRLVVICDDFGRFSASAENEDSVTDMICDWLDDEDGEEDDDNEEESRSSWRETRSGG